MGKQLGCFSVSGTFASVLTLGIILLIGQAQGGRIFNPGPLNAKAGEALGGVISHAELDTRCSACHVAPWENDSMDGRCMNCHQNIALECTNPNSLHGVIFANNSNQKCRACHTEHRGANAPLTAFSFSSFPHESLGFSLKAHQNKRDGSAFTCGDCHAQNRFGIAFDTNTCVQCHAEIDQTYMLQHVVDFGQDCVACHDGRDRFTRRTFDHNQLAFPLQGKHAGLNCGDCHLQARSLADLQATPQECVACHQKDDPHQGRFGSNCATCHTSNGWKPAKFDHNLTGFKLTGKHQQVACESCHQNGRYQGTPMDCLACHGQQDPHQGQLPQCENCHTTEGWKRVNFNHNLTNFPLTGAHISVSCGSCHQTLAFKGAPTECVACHQKDDPHGGRFGNNCVQCHSTTAWRPATFDHNLTRFPLTGAHARVSCTSCHRGENFTSMPSSCSTCHGEPTFHAGAFGLNCAACHSTNAWRPAQFTLSHPEPRVDEHGSGIFHGGASCRTCHPSTVYSYTCSACHSGNPDGDDDHDGDDDDDD